MPQPDEGPGDQLVSGRGIIAAGAYLGLLAAVSMYVLVAIWPEPVPNLGSYAPRDTTARQRDTVSRAGVAAAYWYCDTTGMPARWRADSTVRDPKCVSIAGRRFLLWDEQRLLLIALLCGALGALLHALRSLSTYVGNRKLKQSWLLMYGMLPFNGSLLALVFYVVIRGGFFASNAGVGNTSPFSFAAMALMVGLFNQVAIEKLKQVAESFFTKTEQAADSLTAKSGEAALRSAQRVASVSGGPKDAIDVEGTGFTDATRLEVNGRERQPSLEAPTRLRLLLDATELAVLDNGGELSVQLKDGDKNSNPALTVG
jgi:hypothetical protein